MLDANLSRRGFLAGAAGVAASLGAAGYLSVADWEQAHAAQESAEPQFAGHSACGGCYSKCAYSAYVKNGRLDKIVGDKDHAYGVGRPCARGYGWSQLAYSANRLTDPLKRNENGEFEVIGWDQALQEISDKIKDIIATSGPQALALVETGSVSMDFYVQRFFTALGCANMYRHGVACNLARNSGLLQSTGTGDFGGDYANSKVVMFIGRSFADGIRPSFVKECKDAYDNGVYMIMVDPRYNSSANYCNEWIPINPGTDLALILAMAHVVVRDDLHDKEFIEKETVGFEVWEESLKQYTPEWAAELTGVSAEDIVRLAHLLGEAAPASFIDPGWRAVSGCSYINSGEVGRAIACFDALLGCYNKVGGALLFPPALAFGKLEDPRFAAPPALTEKKLGAKEYPVSLYSMVSANFLVEQVRDGNVRGVMFCQSNMVGGYSNPKILEEILKTLELCVVIEVQMTDTARCATHILPDTSFLERDDLPWSFSYTTPCLTLRSQVIDVVHPNTRPVQDIIVELAKLCGVGQYFDFTLDELAEAQLNTVGYTLAEMREKGSISFPDKTVDFGGPIKWGTKSGKFQFALDDMTQVGLTPDVNWIPPLVMPSGDEFRLIGGKQPIHSQSWTTDIPELIQITHDYDLTRIWLNASKAAELGIEDGDEVEIYNDLNTGRVRVKVTERLNPTCIWIPSPYGCNSPDLTNAYGVGLSQMSFVPFHRDPYYGATMSQETLVKIRKVGA